MPVRGVDGLVVGAWPAGGLVAGLWAVAAGGLVVGSGSSSLRWVREPNAINMSPLLWQATHRRIVREQDPADSSKHFKHLDAGRASRCHHLWWEEEGAIWGEGAILGNNQMRPPFPSFVAW